ncbi:hypothetical protein RGU70_07355 [Herbaspirillum sp. RTI4]|uniref:hypothetical protein n=1 Tax=Herbaspirillum sp. RTI4 TaxID=3048640 RepID=UPI002AB4A6B8|nr:hypothetical protein [Herbaspirillum sp. RTI4]MDY7578135.1 hypothetical protein [Herbaspirillum sp. RTI4]MEA9980724.1 hypothetical protein [Herbaspirillum sp. RTI4]
MRLCTLASALILTLPVLLAACGGGGMAVTQTVSAVSALTSSAPDWNKNLVTGNFSCELDDSVQVKLNGANADSITVDWKGSAYTLQPVSTSTGALRFESSSAGLVWIQIPSKSFLLNSKLGKQLANNCHAA